MRRFYGFCLVTLAIAGVLPPVYPAADATLNPYVKERVKKDKKTIEGIEVPGRPPEVGVGAVVLPEPDPKAGINVLSQVPAFTWSYGCSATAAAMIVGYYDNHYYYNMYDGPTNGGVCPLNNEVAWGHTRYPSVTCGECPLSASRNGLDGRVSKGHVNDYWIDYSNPGPDPYSANGWLEHTPGDCTADYMGTNQAHFGRSDGSTMFYNYSDGAPLSDYIPGDPTKRDGCHGMRLFVESRGYVVAANFSQYILPNPISPSNSKGFTFTDFRKEIDAGRPVMIQVVGHSMVGFGYDANRNVIFLHDTWDNSDHEMTWGGSYSGMRHYGVTVLCLQAPPSPVEVVDFRATRTGAGAITVRWSLAEGADLVGAYITRAESSPGPFVRVNDTLIVPTAGACRFVDRTARSGRSYYYRLEILNAAGGSKCTSVIAVPPR